MPYLTRRQGNNRVLGVGHRTMAVMAIYKDSEMKIQRLCKPFSAALTAVALMMLCRPACSVETNTPVVFTEAMQAELLSAIGTLKAQIESGTEPLGAEVEPLKKIVDEDHAIFGYNDTIIKAALDLVATYDQVKGPLFVAREGWDKGHRKNPTPPAVDVDWTIYHVMQYIMDEVYNSKNIERYSALLDGYKFGCSAYFPGLVDPPADPENVYTVNIDAGSPQYITFEELGGPRRPTGAYAAPGCIATVTVPPSLVNKGYRIRVGAHSWDNTPKRKVTRLGRVSLVFDIVSSETRIVSPLGGGIYIEVPPGADGGVVTLSIRNAVRSPYFSAKSFHKTTLKEWLEVERKRKAPWADFETDKFLMNVPTMWIDNLEDPVKLMKDWDAAMDTLNDLFGQPLIKTRHTMYMQVDFQNRGDAFFPGYPTCNDRYDPKMEAEYGGYANHYLVRGPQYAPNYVFHEQGHAFNCPKYPGEMESVVNLPHVAVWNQAFGYSLDLAFAASRGGLNDTVHTLDNTAIAWMMSLHFADDEPMANYEKQYQWKGHAKYVDIVRLFGWKVLGDYWKAFNDDVANGTYKGRHAYSNDEITLRKCKAVGVDLRPLVRFWGIHEDDAEALATSVRDAIFPASAKIYDTLVHYQSLIPKDNKAFREFALLWWGKEPRPDGFTTERNHAARWESYDEKEADRVRQRVRATLDRYFPDGRPKETKSESEVESTQGEKPLNSNAPRDEEAI